MTKWTVDDIPDQTGRIAIVTGASSGIGLSTAAALAGKGARVILAVRDLERGRRACAHITSEFPDAALTLQKLDLTSLRSVREAADEIKASEPRIDLLINNAGVMFTPQGLTADGFETQFGTNHLGHFAMTGLLMDHLLLTDGSRVVTISSPSHKTRSVIDFDDLHCLRDYDPVVAYGRSKLANLLFTFELNRRLETTTTSALAAHPGLANTGLARQAPKLLRYGWAVLGPVVLQSARKGALPPLRAATDPDALGGQYFGPRGPGEFRGYPEVVQPASQSHDQTLQQRLWVRSEELTEVSYPV